MRQSDASLLVPAFWERLKPVIDELRGQSFKPVLHETLRSKERAAQLVKEGKSKAKGGLSMHCYGLAADLICGEHQWDCRRNHCRFFETLGECAKDAGLTWGGEWVSIVDLPHVQAIPLGLQALARAADPEHMDTFVRTYFAGLSKLPKPSMPTKAELRKAHAESWDDE